MMTDSPFFHTGLKEEKQSTSLAESSLLFLCVLTLDFYKIPTKYSSQIHLVNYLYAVFHIP